MRGTTAMAIGSLVVNVQQARSLAHKHLATDLPKRWRHVQGVARRASEIAPSIGDPDDVLVCAAWLHDIGYAPSVVSSGFHPLDGAQFLRATGISLRVASLVAHHSSAVLEADLRGLAVQLAEFDDERGAIRDALWYCDITTSPDGEPVSATDRIEEIKRRYGSEHLVTRFITLATPGLSAAVSRTEQLLGTA